MWKAGLAGFPHSGHVRAEEGLLGMMGIDGDCGIGTQEHCATIQAGQLLDMRRMGSEPIDDPGMSSQCQRTRALRLGRAP